METVRTAQAVRLTTPGEVATLRDSFELALRAAGRRPKTRQSYLESVDQMATFLAERGMPTNVAAIRWEHVEAYLASLHSAGRAAATVANRFSGVRAFYNWCVEEGEVREHPMRNMRLGSPYRRRAAIRRASRKRMSCARACVGPPGGAVGIGGSGLRRVVCWLVGASMAPRALEFGARHRQPDPRVVTRHAACVRRSIASALRPLGTRRTGVVAAYRTGPRGKGTGLEG